MDHLTLSGRQIAAARTILGWAQAELADRAQISVPTLKRMEACTGTACGIANNVGAVRSALEVAGIVLLGPDANGEGVLLRKPSETLTDLTRQIETLDAQLAAVVVDTNPSPEAALTQMKIALVKNELTKLKNRRVKLEQKT